MAQYFKPRIDLEYSCVLLPQKIEANRAFKYDYEGHGLRRWREHWHKFDDSHMELLEKNFIKVATEAEAISGY